MVNFLLPKRLLSVAVFLLVSIAVLAYDFEVDGIYYNKLSDTEVETTWKTYFDSGNIFEITDYVGDVVVPETVTYEGKTYKVTAIGEKTFQNCFQVTSISLPQSVTSIGAKAFSTTRGLTKDIILPDGVTSIGYDAFGEAHIKSLVIPDGVTEIPYGICYGTRTIRSVKIPDTVTSIGDRAFMFCDTLETVKLPSKLTSIGEYAFDYCDKFERIELPDNLRKIGDNAFINCHNLVINKLPDNLTYLGEGAFCNCYALESVKIPKNITNIKLETFRDCNNIKSVIIEGEVDSIGERAFYGCRSMESINIPESVEYIGKYAFSGCYELASISIPTSVTEIGESAFYHCALKDVVIGKPISGESNDNQTRTGQSTMTIGDEAFYGNSGIESISIYHTTAPICGNNIFSDNVLKEGKLYIPEGTSEEYSNANVWKEFFAAGNAIEGLDSAIDNVVVDSDASIIGYYGIDGQRLLKPQKGINIVRYSDGRCQKVVRK